jgi:hypothetical protein
VSNRDVASSRFTRPQALRIIMELSEAESDWASMFGHALADDEPYPTLQELMVPFGVTEAEFFAAKRMDDVEGS